MVEQDCPASEQSAADFSGGAQVFFHVAGLILTMQ